MILANGGKHATAISEQPLQRDLMVPLAVVVLGTRNCTFLMVRCNSKVKYKPINDLASLWRVYSNPQLHLLSSRELETNCNFDRNWGVFLLRQSFNDRIVLDRHFDLKT